VAVPEISRLRYVGRISWSWHVAVWYKANRFFFLRLTYSPSLKFSWLSASYSSAFYFYTYILYNWLRDCAILCNSRHVIPRECSIITRLKTVWPSADQRRRSSCMNWWPRSSALECNVGLYLSSVMLYVHAVCFYPCSVKFVRLFFQKSWHISYLNFIWSCHIRSPSPVNFISSRYINSNSLIQHYH